MTIAERAISIIFRISAVVMALAIVAVFMPESWMVATHAWLGLGELPRAAIVGYLARSLSLFYAMFGGLLWILAGDIRGNRAVITYLAAVGLLFGAVMVWIDLHVGMPSYWSLMEGPQAIVLSAVVLVLLRYVPRS